ncbi:MAG: hypothetical protein FJY82_06925 [Candidatus Aminicenantes bacterium]|nr:hypothetical protein [Candidatus Aminicenantes bacterium]
MPLLRSSSTRFLTAVLAALVIFALGCGKKESESAPAAANAPKPEAVSPAPAADEIPAGWVEYGSEPHGFTILTPKSFEVSQDVTQTEAGDIALTTYLAELDQVAYGVTCNDFPPALVQGKNAQILIKGGSEGLVNQFAGTVTGEQVLELDGNPGLEIALNGTTQGVKIFAKGRIYLVGTRMYQIFVFAEEGRKDLSAIDRFLKSFKLKT